jgi:hypothetical protein
MVEESWPVRFFTGALTGELLVLLSATFFTGTAAAAAAVYEV